MIFASIFLIVSGAAFAAFILALALASGIDWERIGQEHEPPPEKDKPRFVRRSRRWL